MIAIAAAQATPASPRLPDAASATKAAAKAGCGESRAASSTSATMAAAARARYSQAAASGEPPTTTAWPSEASVKPGPYTDVVSRQCEPMSGNAGSSG